MHTIEINSADLSAASERIPKDEPIFMLNLLRFRERADYGGRADAAPCSGREVYFQRYVPDFNRVAAALGIDGINIFYAGEVVSLPVAPPDEKWDVVAVVEYPNFAAFRRLVESSEYISEADSHRAAALADWRLIAATKMKLPG